MLYLTLFLTFLKIGIFTFGGGYAMLPLVEQEVIAHGWMSEREIVDFIAVSESSPGPFAINMATYVGTSTGGIAGALCTTLGVVLPSFLIILLIARFFFAFRSNRLVIGVMSGLKPTVIGLIAAAVVSVAREVFLPSGLSLDLFKSFWFWISAAIFLLMLYLQLKKLHPILIIVFSAVIGITAGYIGEILL